MFTVLIRYSEIGLKGKNRPLFENQLLRNIQKKLSLLPNHSKESKDAFFEVKKSQGRLLINFFKYLDEEKVNDLSLRLKKIFGIRNFSIAKEIPLNMESIKSEAERILLERNSKQKFKSFRISCHRTNKGFSSNSVQIEKEVGAHIVEMMNKSVSLEKYDENLQIEIAQDKAYVFLKKEEGLGGLPIGVSGLTCARLIDERDAKAIFLMMKRGCDINIIKDPSCSETFKTGKLRGYLELLKQYNNDEELGSVNHNTISEENRKQKQDTQETTKNKIIVTGEDICEQNFKIPEGFIRLKPLAGMTEEMIKKIMI